MIYIKIAVPGEEKGYVDTPENAKGLIDIMVGNAERNDFDRYEISTVEMTEEEFQNLPEFEGF